MKHVVLYHDDLIRQTATITDDVIVYSSANLKKGVSKNGIDWRRWDTNHKVVVSTRGRGNGPRRLNVYTAVKNPRRNWFWLNITSQCGSGGYVIKPELMPEIETLVSNVFGPTKISRPADIRAAAFPLSREFIKPGGKGWIPRGTTLALREHTVMDGARVLFGKTRYQKNLVRAFANNDLTISAYVSAFRGYIPVDNLVRTMDSWESNIMQNLNPRNVRAVLARVPEYTIKKLVSHAPHHDRQTRDILGSFALLDREGFEIPERTLRVKSWWDLENTLSRHVRNLNFANKEITPTHLAYCLEILDIPGVKLVAPRDSHTMQEWGMKMNNCVGSYAEQVRRGETTIVGIFADDKLVGNIQITDDRLIQILGKHNRHLEDDMRTNIVTALVDQGYVDVSTVDTAWGMGGLDAEELF